MQDPNERRIVQEEVVQTPTGTDAARVENRVQVMPTPAEQQVGSLIRAKQIVWLIVGLICVLLALRVLLLAMGANEQAGFASVIYSLSGIFVAPFLGIFGAEPQSGTSYFELASVLAIVVYLLVGWIINRVLEVLLAPRVPPSI